MVIQYNENQEYPLHDWSSKYVKTFASSEEAIEYYAVHGELDDDLDISKLKARNQFLSDFPSQRKILEEAVKSKD